MIVALADLLGLGACGGAAKPFAVLLGIVAVVLGTSGLAHWALGAPRTAAAFVTAAFGCMATAVYAVASGIHP